MRRWSRNSRGSPDRSLQKHFLASIMSVKELPMSDQESNDLPRLKKAWEDGVASGDYRPLNLDAVKKEGRQRLVGKSFSRE